MIRRLVLIMAVLLSNTAMAEDGNQLHDSACLHCHASLTGGDANQLYLRTDRKVKTLKGLKERVKFCAVAADVSWSEQQRELVVNYLRQQFYRF